VDTLSAPYGQTISLNDVKAKLTPDVRVVFMQATETSTGVRHDVEGIAGLVKNTDALLVVDAITGLGTTHLNADATDVIIGGSQKALMVPPGLSYLCASDRAWQRMESSRQPRYYFDLRKERKAAEKGEAAYTPAVALIAALGAALDYLAAQGGGDVAEGRRLLVDNAERCAAMTRAAVIALGLELFAPVSPSAAVTAVKAPAGASSSDVVKKFKATFGGIMADGQGEMKGQLFRIAHIGYFDYMDTIAMIGALEHVLAEITPGKFELGAGLAAAQRVYAEQANPRTSATGA
jgi:aspartate aminotransferase-like enzyme